MTETVLVTGASRGIGYATAKLFAQKGFNVAAVARDQSALTKLAQDVKQDAYQAADFVIDDLILPLQDRISNLLGRELPLPDSITTKTKPGKILPFRCDLSKERSLASLLERVTSKHALAGVVLNAGLAFDGDFMNSKPEDRLAEMQLNYHANARLVQGLVPHFIEQGYGHILCVGSLTALVPFPEHASYAASKAALYSLMRSIKIELAEEPIDVSMILPGLTATEMTEGLQSALPRTSPEEVAAAIWRCWLKPKFPAIVGRLNQSAAWLNRANPEVFDILVALAKPLLPRRPEE